MTFKLRDYQQRCVDLTLAALDNHDDAAPIVSAATGSGKSVVVSALADELLTRSPGAGRVLVATHRAELVQQNHAKLPRHLKGSIYSASLGKKDLHGQVIFANVQSIQKNWTKLPRIQALLIDEAHFASKGYFDFIENVRKVSPHMRTIGLTATPYSGSGVWLHMLPKHRIFSGISVEVGIGELLSKGYLAPLTPYRTNARLKVDDVRVDARTGDFAQDQLQAAVDVPELVLDCAAEIKAIFAERKSVLVFCSGVEHTKHVAAALGHEAKVVLADTPMNERMSIVESFKAGKIKYLCACEVLLVGFDAPRTDGIACLRPSRSPLVWVQLCLDMETEILTSHGWKNADTMRVGDCALALDEVTGKGVWSPVEEVVRRPMSPDEQWVEYNAPRANFRVTDQHRMIYEAATWRNGFEKRSGPAIEMAQLKNGVRMPTAVHIDQPGVPLTDDELWFIGMMMTDGTWGHVRAEISQSERHPEIIERIERTLNNMGVPWTKTELAPPRAGSVIKSRNRRWCYRMPMNLSKGGRSGVGYLRPYLDKDVAPALFAMSKQQFATMLSGVWDGDGFKTAKCPSADWTPRSLTICTSRKVAADRLQALGVMNGYTVHLRIEHAHSVGRKPMCILTFTDKDWRNVGGSGDRPQIEVKPATNEEVWCVRTTADTIVTRRHGKVTVMGNCGRGMRPFPGKQDCLVADFCGNADHFGPVDEIEGRPPQNSKGEAPTRVCDGCFNIILACLRKCPHCGMEYEFEEHQRHLDPNTGLLISGVIKNPDGSRTYPVDRVEYRRETTNAGDPALVAEYFAPNRTSPVATDYYNIWHHKASVAQRDGEKWLRRLAIPGGIPTNVVEALVRAQFGALKVPSSVTIAPGSIYPIRFGAPTT